MSADCSYRNARFARNTRLAKSATIAFQAELLVGVLSCGIALPHACELIVPGLGYGACRTALHAHAASSLSVKQAVCVVIFIGARCRWNLSAGDHRTAAYGFALGSDQAVAETESSQAGSIGCMAFRPRRGHAKALRVLGSEI